MKRLGVRTIAFSTFLNQECSHFILCAGIGESFVHRSIITNDIIVNDDNKTMIVFLY